MREDVQVGVAAVEVVETARACGTNRAIEAQKGANFMVAIVGKETNGSKTGEKY
jgi:hypothetical protein